MAKLTLVETEDGSYTLYDAEIGSHYHSRFGAAGESRYVYLEAGKFPDRLRETPEVRILEIGLGTGLNFVLTLEAALKRPETQVRYRAFEPYPPPPELLAEFYAKMNGQFDLPEEIWRALPELLQPKNEPLNLQNVQAAFIQAPWTAETRLAEQIDIIYYDAFGPFSAPELWAEGPLGNALSYLRKGGRLVTFSVSGAVRRFLKKENYPHLRPKGYGRKREMLIVEARPDA